VIRRRTPRDTESECGQTRPSAHLRFTSSASFYLDAYRSYRATAASTDGAQSNTELDPFGVVAQLPERKARVKLAMASKGTEAIPFLLEMLRSADREERDDARGVISLMGGDARVVDSLTESVASATDAETTKALAVALGATENPLAIPCLARMLGAPGVDRATTQAALTSVATLTNQRFEESTNPKAAALDWLRENGYRPAPIESQTHSAPASETTILPGGLVHIQVQMPPQDEGREVIRASTEEIKE
jgi:hypothetical protein